MATASSSRVTRILHLFPGCATNSLTVRGRKRQLRAVACESRRAMPDSTRARDAAVSCTLVEGREDSAGVRAARPTRLAVRGVCNYSTEQFASIFRQLGRENRRHSGAMSRLFAAALAEKRREMRRVAIVRDTPL